MKELQHILAILHSKHLQTEPVLGNLEGSDESLVIKLARDIIANKHESDWEAARKIYGESYDKHTFEILKSKLRQRALTSLLLLDFIDTDSSPRDAAKHRLYKQIIQANLLLLFGARQVGAKLLHKIQGQATQYLITDIRLQSSWMLRSHYWLTGEKKLYDAMTNTNSKLIQVMTEENRAEELYQRSTIAFVTSKARHNEMIQFVKAALKEFDAFEYSSESVIITINRFRLKVLSFQLLDKYAEVITESKKAMHFLKRSKRLYNQNLYTYFLMTLCESLLMQRKYAELSDALIEIRGLIDYTNPNRILIERIAFLANLASGKFGEAERILNDVLSLPYFTLTLHHHKEEWVLFKDYFNTIQAMQGIYLHGPNSSEATGLLLLLIPSRKLPVFSKDKLGVNISIVILQVIKLVLTKDFKKLLQVDKALDNYLYRYLNADKEYKRSIAFLKLLRLLIKEDLIKDRVNRKSHQYLKTLSSQNNESQLEPIEIIPYDILWDLLLRAI